MAESTWTIFYSWQSDLPNRTNRSFILDALEKATTAISKDPSTPQSPVVDRDTQGLPGSPHIALAIFSKIDRAGVFVCDLSIVNPGMTEEEQDVNGTEGTVVRKLRPTPNPNVLIEFGYAMKALGPDRIIMVFNTAFGDFRDLPFDINTQRVLPYHVPTNAESKADEKRKLQGMLENALRTIFESVAPSSVQPEPPSQFEEARGAIEHNRPNQVMIVDRYMKSLVTAIVETAPKYERPDTGFYATFLDAVQRATVEVAEFAQLAAIGAATGSRDSIMALYGGLSGIAEKCHLSVAGPGIRHYSPVDFDYFRFIGYELMTVLVAALIHRQQWTILQEMLDSNLRVSNVNGRQAGTVGYRYFSQELKLPKHDNEYALFRSFVPESKVIDEVFKDHRLADIIPLYRFAEADLFLYLRAYAESGEGTSDIWEPWSAILEQGPPPFIASAERQEYAKRIISVLNISSIVQFQEVTRKAHAYLSKIFGLRHKRLNPLDDVDFSKLGTR